MQLSDALLNSIYKFTTIPIFYFENNILTQKYPNSSVFLPPQKYIQHFISSYHKASYLMTDFYSFFGCVKDRESKHMYIFGPISPLPYQEKILSIIRKEFLISESSFAKFSDFLFSIRPYRLLDFENFLAFISLQIHGHEIAPKDLTPDISLNIDNILKRYTEGLYQAKESYITNNSIDVENRLLKYIENGDILGLEAYMQQTLPLQTGAVAKDNLRQLKNEVIISATLYSRSSIKAGLPSDLAFQLSDAYIQQTESANSAQSIQVISKQMLLDYTTRVHELHYNIHGNMIIKKAIHFVQQNTNCSINVSHVANHVGLSRAYFSHKFKEEMGFELSSFIKRCKLEEAKDLLLYTNKTISEISNYLCFSSQPHFQTAFKKQYHLTPQQFRTK